MDDVSVALHILITSQTKEDLDTFEKLQKKFRIPSTGEDNEPQLEDYINMIVKIMNQALTHFQVRVGNKNPYQTIKTRAEMLKDQSDESKKKAKIIKENLKLPLKRVMKIGSDCTTDIRVCDAIEIVNVYIEPFWIGEWRYELLSKISDKPVVFKPDLTQKLKKGDVREITYWFEGRKRKLITVADDVVVCLDKYMPYQVYIQVGAKSTVPSYKVGVELNDPFTDEFNLKVFEGLEVGGLVFREPSCGTHFDGFEDLSLYSFWDGHSNVDGKPIYTEISIFKKMGPITLRTTPKKPRIVIRSE